MLKISIVDKKEERRLLVEGKLAQPWAGELQRSWRGAGENLGGRKLIVDLSHATLITRDGEEEILALMKEGAHFSGCGVLTKYVVKQLAHRCQARCAEQTKK
jgi:hypothetical protein